MSVHGLPSQSHLSVAGLLSYMLQVHTYQFILSGGRIYLLVIALKGKGMNVWVKYMKFL